MFKRVAKIIGWCVGIILLLFVGLLVYIRIVSSIDPPTTTSDEWKSEDVIVRDSTLRTLGNNWFRKSESGLYEMYAEGEPFARGLAIGKMSEALVQYQEK